VVKSEEVSVGHIKRSIEIQAAPERVFDRLVDLDGLPDWSTIVASTSKAPHRPLQAGDTFEQVIRVADHELESRWEVAELERPQHVLYRATGVLGGRLEMRQTVASLEGERSRVELEVDYTLPGGILTALIDRLGVEQANEREAERSLQQLKHVIESSAL
jgi:uncharacterized membrane protein